MDACKKYAGPVFGLALFCIAMWFLYQKVQEITWQEFLDGLAGIPTWCLAVGAALVVVNYLVLTGNDWLAIEYSAGEVPGVGDAKLPYRKVALTSFLGYALGNNIGTVAAGIPVRARFYGAEGLGPAQIVRMIGFLGLSFWVGFGIVGGVFLSVVNVAVPENIQLPLTSRTLGVVLLIAAGTYLAVCLWWRRPIRLVGGELRPPGPGLVTRQSIVASLDLMIVTATLYVLMPTGTETSYPDVTTAYLLALAAAMITQVPGGLGVLEAVLLGLIGHTAEASVLGSLLIFRIFYYVLPLIVALVLLVVAEAMSRPNVVVASGE